MEDPKLNEKLSEIQALLYAIRATTEPTRITKSLKEIRSAANYLLRRRK